MSLSRSRKAQVSVQINWIFVLIVGAIILIFFVGIVMKQKTVSGVKHNIAISEALDTILVSAQVATGTASLVNVPDIHAEFDCNNYYVGEFDTGINKALGRSRVIFVPNVIEGRQLVTWSLDWNLPYKIQDFLYVTSTQMRYVFVFDADSKDSENFARVIFDSMPDKMNKEIYGYDGAFVDPVSGNPVGVEFKNNYKTRFVFFGLSGDIELDESFNDQDVSAVNILAGNNQEVGSVLFFKHYEDFGFRGEAFKPGITIGEEEIEESTLPYFDYNPRFTSKKFYPSLYGAIFTDSMELYECMYRKAFTRYSFITDVYLSRITRMLESRSAAMVERGCTPGLYGYTPGQQANRLGYGALEELDETAASCRADLRSNCHLGYDVINSLVSANERVQVESCPLIY